MKEAIRLYKLSAGQGNFFAQNSLAICYKNGDGVEIDESEDNEESGSSDYDDFDDSDF